MVGVCGIAIHCYRFRLLELDTIVFCQTEANGFALRSARRDDMAADRAGSPFGISIHAQIQKAVMITSGSSVPTEDAAPLDRVTSAIKGPKAKPIAYASVAWAKARSAMPTRIPHSLAVTFRR